MGLSTAATASLLLAGSAAAVYIDVETTGCLIISLPVHQSRDRECGAFGTRAVSVRASRTDAEMLSAMDSLHWRHTEDNLESGERLFHWEVAGSDFALQDGDVHVFSLAASAALDTSALTLEVTKHCAAPPNLPVTTHEAVVTAAAFTVSPAPAALCAPPSLSQRATSALRSLLGGSSASPSLTTYAGGSSRDRKLLDMTASPIEENFDGAIDGGDQPQFTGIAATEEEAEAQVEDDEYFGLLLVEGGDEQTEPLLSAAAAGIAVV